MAKLPPARDKYFLRSLHQEIDFYDRQLAHLNKYMDFATEADRKTTEDKLIAKRAVLEKTAKELAASGIEFNSDDLPRSFRADVLQAEAASEVRLQS